MNILDNSCIRFIFLLAVFPLFLLSGIFTPANSQKIAIGDFGDVKVDNPDGSALQTIHTFPFDPITTNVVTNPTNGILLTAFTASTDESGSAVTLDDQLLIYGNDDTHLQSGSNPDFHTG